MCMGIVLHAYVLQLLLLYKLLSFVHHCHLTMNKTIKSMDAHELTYLFVPNLAFLMVVPLISRPNVQFNTSFVVAHRP